MPSICLCNASLALPWRGKSVLHGGAFHTNCYCRLLGQIFKLVAEGHIKPLYIGKTFGFENVVDAFRYMRDGKHMGKIVITDSDRSMVNVPVSLDLLRTASDIADGELQIRPALPVMKLRSDVSYLIAGGFKGLCGSLAIYLARHGAKYMVALSRSNYDDEASKGVIYHLNAMGTHVDLVRGDITQADDVRRCFKSATKPIGGIIQGAMVLRVSLAPICCHGSWKLI